MDDLTLGQPVTFTLGEAAKAAGISKPSLSKAIQSGRLSAEKRPDGSYSIQAGELFRVYPPDRKATHSVTPGVSNAETRNDNGLLGEQVERLREQLEAVNQERQRERTQLTDQIADLRKRLDIEGEERRRLTAILTVSPSPTNPAEPVSIPKPRGFLRRVMGF